MITGCGVNGEVTLEWPALANVGAAVELSISWVWDDCGAMGLLISISGAPKFGVGASTGLTGQLHGHGLWGTHSCLADLHTGLGGTIGHDFHAGAGFGYDLDVSSGGVILKPSAGIGSKIQAAVKMGVVFHWLIMLASAPCPCPPPPWWLAILGRIPGIGGFAHLLHKLTRKE
jgi:hypothetical protein